MSEFSVEQVSELMQGCFVSMSHLFVRVLSILVVFLGSLVEPWKFLFVQVLLARVPIVPNSVVETARLAAVQV